MKRCLLCVLSCVCLLGAATTVQAGEQHLKFLEGLRARGYYDTALHYLDQLEKRPNVPQEVRTVLPFERAVTLVQNADEQRSPEAKSEQLDRAVAQLQQFREQAPPDHPRQAKANFEEARILLERARVKIYQADSPANEGKKEELRGEARDLIAQARQRFQQAHDRYQKKYEAFPKFIPKDEKQQYEARQETETNLMRSELDLALCTYEEAQTYDPGSEKRKELLIEASKSFEEIHSKYRSQVGGLYARMWQGKCFQELNDLSKALGIYNELLGHPGDSAVMRKLQDKVKQFRLICLNHRKRQDYQLVIQEAQSWIKNAGARVRTQIGLGIRWQLALAQESLGMGRKDGLELSESEKERYLRQARDNARYINRYPGPYKDVSTFMIRRLDVELQGESGDPEDFDGALGLANKMIKEIGPLKEKRDNAKNQQQRRKFQNDLELHLKETARILRLALSLAEEDTALNDVNRSRYLLAYVYLQLRQNYKSAVLGEFVGRNFPEESPQTALDSAYMALAAYVQAYNDASGREKDAVMQRMQQVSGLITDQWPDSDRANDARMTLGRIYKNLDQPVKAADWYSRVPGESPQYAEAQEAAGQAYWTAYLEAAQQEEDDKPPAEELRKWQQAAEKHLQNGIEKLQAQAPQGKEPPEKLTAAKVSLAQILVNKGDYQGALDLLKQEPHAPLQAIVVEQGSQRPQEGVKSRSFAGLCYQLLLRCYVGTQQIDQALQAMDELERVGGSDNQSVYVKVGQMLQKELETLRGTNPERVPEVLKSFETFLDKLYQAKDKQTFGALVWIAETYYGLGDGVDDETRAKDYFDKSASTYNEILDRARNEPDFVQESRLTGVRLRLVKALRQKGDFQAARDQVARILGERPRALDAQFEAARVYQDWAESGGADSYRKFLDAINGTTIGSDEVPVWGWAQIAMRLQRLSNVGRATPEHEERHRQARYNVSWCRRQYGILGQLDSSKRAKTLEAAKSEIETFARISGDLGDKWWDKFNGLYREIQNDLNQVQNANEPVVDLERPEEYPAGEQSMGAQLVQAAGSGDESGTTETGEKNQAEQQAAAADKTQEAGGGLLGPVLGILFALAVAGGMIYYMMQNPAHGRRMAYAGSAPTAASGKNRRQQQSRPAAKSKTASGKSSSAQTGAKAKQTKQNQTKTASQSQKKAKARSSAGTGSSKSSGGGTQSRKPKSK